MSRFRSEDLINQTVSGALPLGSDLVAQAKPDEHNRKHPENEQDAMTLSSSRLPSRSA
jgi:hypothetical protein